MKYLKTLAFLIGATLMLAACEGTTEPDLVDPDPEIEDVVKEAEVRLIADKTEVEADGQDCVTFRVIRTDESGKEEDLTERYPRAVRIMNTADGETLPFKTFTTTSVRNKEIEYRAVFEDTESVNTVTVKFKNREKYEKYFQKVALIELTGTWCIGCPAMVEAIHNVEEELQEHMVLMAVHLSSDDDKDPLEPVTNNGLGMRIVKEFGISSIPYCIFDLNDLTHVSTKANISNYVSSYLANHYATCGVRVISSSLDGMSLKIKAGITSDKGGEYDLGWALVADGFIYNGGTIESGIYDDVLIGASENFYKVSADRFTVEADKEVVKEFTCELPYLTEGFDPSKARVIVYATRITENDYTSSIVDNITDCPLGQGNDYILN